MSWREAFQGLTEAAIAAGLEAAALEESKGTVEKAERILREMQAAEDAPTAAAGLAALAALHQRQGWLRQARAEWSLLARDFPRQPVPADGGMEAAEALARKTLAARPFADGDTGPPAGLPDPPWRRLWEVTNARGRYVQVLSLAQPSRPGGLASSQFLEEHIFLFQRERTSRLICRRVRDGKTVYEQDTGQTRSFSTRGVQGHVVVWASGTSATVFGLVSGKALWSAKGSASGARSIHVLRLQGIVVGSSATPGSSSVLVMRPNASTTRVLDLATGRVLWERSVRGTSIGHVQSSARFLILALGRGQDLWVCDTLTGEKLGTIQLKGRYLRQPVMTRHGLLCHTYAVGRAPWALAMHKLPSGEVRWQWDARQPIRNLWVVDPDTVCIAGTDGSLNVVDLASGAVRAKLKPPQAGAQVYAACLGPTGKHLYVSGYGRNRKPTLSVFDLATGKRLQSFGYGTSRYFRPMQLHALARSGELLPIVVHDPPTKTGRVTRASQLCQVKFFGRADGKCREELKLPTSRKDGKFHRLRTVHVQGGVLVVALYTGIEVFGHDPRPAKAAGADAQGKK